jgi:hypothetical protein
MERRRVVRSAVRLAVLSLLIAGSIGVLRYIQVARAGTAFTPGNIVVYRVGTGGAGTSLLSSGNPIFLDEYTPTGSLVQSVALPTSASGTNHRLIASGTATSEGLLTRSTDGQYLLVTGYDAAIPTTSVAGTSSATTPRVVGRIDANANIDTTTALTDFASANNPRGVASTNGSDIWVEARQAVCDTQRSGLQRPRSSVRR